MIEALAIYVHAPFDGILVKGESRDEGREMECSYGRIFT
jgi:hypothetical protein